jgi:hypothetical protein
MQSRVAIFREEKKFRGTRKRKKFGFNPSKFRLFRGTQNARSSVPSHSNIFIKKTRNSVPNHLAEDIKARNSDPNHYAEEKNTRSEFFSKPLEQKKKLLEQGLSWSSFFKARVSVFLENYLVCLKAVSDVQGNI